ncbi:hypothetical protein LY90DRAFT_70311 [Neocallimastix californiae]|uniref:Uncharacterized protein n=1 Tax=Neocallimastix californiae TaxID=1754190 RepID=A0A1Y2F4A4_9FUNG|nr:hypothetical protein LY90DRAFT_70311 [Neocallimastix californiae]|eukprot:ORY78701.1 hypothetical protein LY90DRAFT_70311 [Neocallimastix californiae]
MSNNNDDFQKNTNKLNINFFEKKLYPLFNSLPLDAPVDWMIPFLSFIEDFQFFQFIFTRLLFTNLRKYVIDIFIIFTSPINNSIYYYFFFGFFIVFISYTYIIVFIHLKTNGGKTLSKRSLWIFNSIYNVFFKYMNLFVLNFFTKCIFICNKADNISGIPKCKTTLSNIMIGISIACIVLIVVYGVVYNNFNFNANCLSHAKYFGSIHKANYNEILFIKLILTLIFNVVIEIIYSNGINIMYTIIGGNIVVILSFLYLAFIQLKNQPYYSNTVNNYKFAIYFSIGSFSLYSFIVYISKINSSQFVCDISPFILIVLLILSYKFNSFYQNKTVKRIYKKFQEKEMINKLRKTTSSDELKLSPDKLKNKKIFQSVERITKEVYIKKDIKVFNNYFECETACRFLRHNRDIEAFLLMKKLFEEGINQFKHEADIYIMAWYYIYSMKKFYKENNLLAKYDLELFNCENILNSAMELKLDMRRKYLINKALTYIEIEKRENTMKINSQDIESSIKLEELKLNAIKCHIHGLKEIKNLFTKLRSSTNSKNVALYSSNISSICRYQNLANSKYSHIIRQFPDATDIVQYYVIFLTDVMNNDELAYKYSLGIPKINNQNSQNGSSNEVTSKSNDKNNSSLNNNFNARKALFSSSNSLGSNQQSDYSSTSGIGKELRKKINSKNYMMKKYVNPIKSLKFNMNIFIILFILVFGIQILVTVYIFNKTGAYSEVLALNMNIPGAIATAAFNVRLLSYSLMLGNMKYYGKYIGALKGALGYLDNLNSPSVSEYMDIEVSENLAAPVGYYAYDNYESLTLADSYKKFITNVKYCINREPLRVNETLFDILYEPHFRYFIVNSKRDFDLMFSQCKKVLYNKIIKLFDIIDTTFFIFQIVLIIIILYIAYITFIPLKKVTYKISSNAFRMFKYFSKENFEYIITNYEEKIETLCENFDLDKDITENNLKKENKKSYTKIKLIISYIIIIGYVLVSGLPISSLSSNTRKSLLISQKSIDCLY